MLAEYFFIGLFIFLLAVAAVRYLLLVRHYIRTGSIGDPDRSFVNLFFDGDRDAIIFYFIGVHPGMILMDVLAMGLISTIAAFLSLVFVSIYFALAHILVPITVLALALFLYARWARKRVETKQEFTSKLKGDF